MSDESAFPTQMWDEELKEATWLDGGLTKRELFAAMMLQGILSKPFLFMAPVGQEGCWHILQKQNAELAVANADALLAELAKGGGNG